MKEKNLKTTSTTRNYGRLTRCFKYLTLPKVHLYSNLAKQKKLARLVHNSNPNNWEAKAGLTRDFKSIQVTQVICLKNKNATRASVQQIKEL